MATFVPPQIAAGAKTMDARWYVSPDVFAAERERDLRALVDRRRARGGRAASRRLRRRRRRRRKPHPRARRGRRAARALQRLPPPRDAALRERRGNAQLDPVPVSRLDVRARRHAAGGAQHGRTSRALHAPTIRCARQRPRCSRGSSSSTSPTRRSRSRSRSRRCSGASRAGGSARCASRARSTTSSPATGSSSFRTTPSAIIARYCTHSSTGSRPPTADATISPKDRSSAATRRCVIRAAA